MTNTLRLHGRAIPFGKTIPIKDGLFEVIEPNAFDKFLARPTNDVDLLAADHDGRIVASTSDASLHLFAGARGLNFYANIDADYGQENWALIRAMRRSSKRMDQCSVNFLSTVIVADTYLGARRERVSAARIDHIAVCSGARYGAETGAWIAGDENAPAFGIRIQQMSAEFDDAISVSPLREFNRRGR